MCIFDKSLCDADPADPGTTEYLFLKQLVFSYYSTLTASSHRYTVDYLLPHWAGCSLRIATMVVWSLVLSEYGCLVFQWCPTLVTSWTVAHRAPLSIRFPRQEYWSSCHFLLWAIFPAQGLYPHFLCFLSLADRYFTTEPPGKPI